TGREPSPAPATATSCGPASSRPLSAPPSPENSPENDPGGRSESSADLLRQLDDDPLRAADRAVRRIANPNARVCDGTSTTHCRSGQDLDVPVRAVHADA